MAGKKKTSKAVVIPAPNNKRVVRNRAINQQSLLEKLAVGGHVSRIGVLLKRLDTMRSSVAKKTFLEREEQAKYITETGIIKTELDSHFKILNKFLPDLRASETNDEGENPLAEAIASWTKALNK